MIRIHCVVIGCRCGLSSAIVATSKAQRKQVAKQAYALLGPSENF